MNPRIPYGKQHVTEEDIQAVEEVLRSDFWTQGPAVPKFEKNFAQYVGSKYAVAVANGTAALHLCTLALNVKSGDKVITSPITFVASANCVAYCGGEVVFADIDRETYLLDINAVRKLLEADTEKKIKGIIPVDFAGRVVDFEAFRALADEFSCWLIEDACHAPGGSFTNAVRISIKAGSGTYADLAIFSFHPVKHIAAGEGGMITTNDKELYERLLILRTHGIQQNLSKRIYDDSLWYYEMQELGYNYRLTDIQAALGNSQLQRAEAGLKRRKEIAHVYKEAFKNNSNIVDRNEAYSENHAYHLYVIEVKNRKGLHSFLRKKNIFAQIHYIPAHLMPYYRSFGWKEGDMPHAEEYYKECLSLPMYPTMSDEEQQYVIETIMQFYKN
jgi:UDP-4-amino-4,6-dideoxy-N-acetyl-beta-L-altrosamine transaminase